MTSESQEPRIVVIGAFDTKAREYAFLRDTIVSQGGRVLTVNAGVLGSTDLFPVDVEAEELARAVRGDLAALRGNRDHGQAMATMAKVSRRQAPFVHAG